LPRAVASAAGGPAQSSAFNPAIGVVLQGKASAFSQDCPASAPLRQNG